MSMLTPLEAAAWLFGIAALGGIAQALIRFSGRPYPPAWLSMLHGMLAAAGLTLMLYAACTTGVPDLAKLSIALFVVAAAGGAFLNLRYHMHSQPLPKGIMIGHALLAVAAYACLLLALRPAV
ncbi:MAG TPA: hypothetical protein VFL14_15605 [Xanthomonadales bacterium]|nr:hypothetical protein [Xanthomonadales bacterium]